MGLLSKINYFTNTAYSNLNGQLLDSFSLSLLILEKNKVHVSQRLVLIYYFLSLLYKL